MLKDTVFTTKLEQLHRLRSVRGAPAVALAAFASEAERNRMCRETERRLAVLDAMMAKTRFDVRLDHRVDRA